MPFVLFLIFISFIILLLLPKGHRRKTLRPATLPPIRLVSGADPFEQFSVASLERAQRVGLLV